MRGRSVQAGMVLVAALVFLLLLTLLTFGDLERALLQERMAGHLRDGEQARLAAESTLRGVEWMLWRAAASAEDGAAPSCASAFLAGHCYRYDPADAARYGPAGLVTAFRSGSGWIEAGAAVYRGPGGLDYTAPVAGDESAALARKPLYLVEDLGPEASPQAVPSEGVAESGRRRLFRITVRASGGRADTVRVLESTFAVGGGKDDPALSRRRAWRELAHD